MKDNCIKKVLPGIEFSVEFAEGKVIHIVTIFDDRDDDKVKNIEQVMTNGIGKTTYKKTRGAYSKSDYFEVLNAINIDFVMIAHQKKTVSSQHKAHANDVMVLGKDTFNELIFLDYFDASFSLAHSSTTSFLTSSHVLFPLQYSSKAAPKSSLNC